MTDEEINSYSNREVEFRMPHEIDLMNQWHINWRKLPDHLYVKATNEYE
jgi:hypothetical protein